MGKCLRTIELNDSGDYRGHSFAVPAECFEFLRAIRDVHIATINPKAVRGNHYHLGRREVLCIFHTDSWSLHWDSGPDTEVLHETFSGSGVIVVEVEPLGAHAVRNDGNSVIQMVGFSDMPFDPSNPDAYARKVI